MMIDFALDAERNEGKPPREAIYQACLLRFRPILMTTMAAVLGALPLMLGTGDGLGTAPSARHRHRRRPAGQPVADAVHDAGDLSLVRSSRGALCRALAVDRRPSERVELSHEPLDALHPPAGRDDAADFGLAAAGIVAFFKLPVSPLPQVDFPTISVQASCRARARRMWRPRSRARWSAISGRSPTSPR